NQTIYRATLDFDGVFRMHAHYINNGSDKIIETLPKSSKTCEVKGVCGFNSYCTFDDDKQLCICLPGYKFIDENETTLGCERNYFKAECMGDKDGAAFYNMFPMNNIVWGDHPYSESGDISSEQNCSFACLVDCNCWAALYEEARCKKHGFPFRYVRRTREADESNTAFLKVGKNSVENWKQNDTIFSPQPAPIKTTNSGIEVQKANGHWEHGAE
ncbi:G-type lectin S-receptor-like serine/threonine protein kinase RLK1-like, partial [Trifolium medium]|nr:G-type lectin S-receptor-like serine/threonine protein kinase RLK1-like [Trifolium medium]